MGGKLERVCNILVHSWQLGQAHGNDSEDNWKLEETKSSTTHGRASPNT